MSDNPDNQPPMRHELKTHPFAFHAIRSGIKRFEYRCNDRDFGEGDVLVLREWDPERGEYTGQAEEVRVTYLLTGPDYGVPCGYVVMSIKRRSGMRSRPRSRRPWARPWVLPLAG